MDPPRDTPMLLSESDTRTCDWVEDWIWREETAGGLSTSGAPKLCIQLSWNSGANWTAAKSTSTLGTIEQTFTLGDSTDNWGHIWTNAQLSNANFRVRIFVATSTARDFSLDWIMVCVTYK